MAPLLASLLLAHALAGASASPLTPEQRAAFAEHLGAGYVQRAFVQRLQMRLLVFVSSCRCLSFCRSPGLSAPHLS